jgi:hypothetical protein
VRSVSVCDPAWFVHEVTDEEGILTLVVELKPPE